MGDGGGENVPGNGVRQELLQGQLLGPAAGKLGYTVFKAGDNKAGGFAHAGENGDVPGCALPDAQGALLPGDDAVKVAALYVQLMGWVTTDRESLQNSLAAPGGFQGGAAEQGLTVFVRIHEPAFRPEIGHKSSSRSVDSLAYPMRRKQVLFLTIGLSCDSVSVC